MNKVIEFIKKYKKEIIIVLMGLSSLAVSLSQLGGQIGTVCGIVVSILAIVVYFLKSGFDETMMKMCIALIKTIVDMNKDKDKVASASKTIETIPTEELKNKYIEKFKGYL